MCKKVCLQNMNILLQVIHVYSRAVPIIEHDQCYTGNNEGFLCVIQRHSTFNQPETESRLNSTSIYFTHLKQTPPNLKTS